MKKKLTLSLIFFALGTMYASEAEVEPIYRLHTILPPSTNSSEEIEKENSIMEEVFGEHLCNPNVKWKFGSSMTISPLPQKDEKFLFLLKMNTDESDEGITIESNEQLSMDGSQWEFDAKMLVKQKDSEIIEGYRISIPPIVNDVRANVANQYKPKIFQGPQKSAPQSSFSFYNITKPMASIVFLVVLAAVMIHNCDAIQMQFSHILHTLLPKLPNFFMQG